MEDIKQVVREFIVENFLFGDDSVNFSEEESLMDRGLIDSTGILELITFLEEKYNIKVDNDEIYPENLDSLNNIEHFMKDKIKAVTA